MEVTKSNTLGLVEKITLYGSDGLHKNISARVDTGAVISSIDTKLAADLKLGPVIRSKKVRNANGVAIRPIVKCVFKMKGQEFKTEVTIADRKKMKYRALIGQNLLKKAKFYINPRKKIVH